MGIRNSFPSDRPLSFDTFPQALLPGLWIVTCRYLLAGSKLYVDRDFHDDQDLSVWHFTPTGALFVSDRNADDIEYVWGIDGGRLHIESQGGGRFGKAGKYNFSFRGKEAILGRLEPIQSGCRALNETEWYRMVRYMGADYDYRKLKDYHYSEAIEAGSIGIGAEWEEQRLYEQECRFFERLCAEKGILIDEDDEY